MYKNLAKKKKKERVKMNSQYKNFMYVELFIIYRIFSCTCHFLKYYNSDISMACFTTPIYDDPIYR